MGPCFIKPSHPSQSKRVTAIPSFSLGSFYKDHPLTPIMFSYFDFTFSVDKYSVNSKEPKLVINPFELILSHTGVRTNIETHEGEKSAWRVENL